MTAAIALCLTALAAGDTPDADAPGMPGAGPIPDGLGANIHFTDPRPGEMKMLAASGMRWLRMDLVWSRVEKQRGRYDWSPYDRLLAAAKPHGLRFLFILDYSNKLYEDGRYVRTAEGRAAYARFAAAAAKRYRGRGILWEIWNEPNHKKFWTPPGTTEDYVKMALAAGKAIHAAAPGERIIGPATSGIPFDFLEACFADGLLEQWSAVSVHPYRGSHPETAAADYARLRRLIDAYAPKGKRVPILSGEWGYSTASIRDERQGKYLARQWLGNLSQDVRLSIWYDWHDDGPNAEEREHNFGMVEHRYHKGRDPVYDPKPAYRAARALTTALKGLRFDKRLWTGDGQDYVLLFAGDTGAVRLAAWTTSPCPRRVTVATGPGRFTVTGHTGGKLPAVTADAGGLLALELTDAPRYLAPEAGNVPDLLRLAAACERAPASWTVRVEDGRAVGGFRLTVTNPLGRAVDVRSGGKVRRLPAGGELALGPFPAGAMQRNIEPVRVESRIDFPGLGSVGQVTRVEVANPLGAALLPPTDDALLVRLANPTGSAFAGAVTLTDLAGARPAATEKPVTLADGRTRAVVRFPAEKPVGRTVRCGVRVANADGQVELSLPPRRLTRLERFGRFTPGEFAKAWRVVADGERSVESTQSIALACPPGGPPTEGLGCVRLRYDMARGWKFIRVVPQEEAARKVAGTPRLLRMWLHGDGSGHSPRMRFRDATGQVFQPVADEIDWTGWRLIEFRLDGHATGHWGGAGDGVVHYPIELDTLLLIDKSRDEPGAGEVVLAAPVLVE